MNTRTLRSNWGIMPPGNGRRLLSAPALDGYDGDLEDGAIDHEGSRDEAFTTTTATTVMPAAGRAKREETLTHSSNAAQMSAEEAGFVRCEPLIDAERAAKILKLHLKTVQRMAQAERLPAFKIGGVWRFRESSLDEWLRAQLKRSYAPPIP